MRSMDVAELELPEEVRAALRRFLDEAVASSGDRLEDVVLFGSAARGELHEGSDVDLLVVWSGDTREALNELVGITTRILAETGVDLSVHPVSTSEFRSLAEMRTGFYENVEREGVQVAG